MIKLVTILGLGMVMTLRCMAASDAAEQAPAARFSEAETRMWMTDQMRSIKHPVNLHYAFHKTGSFEPDLNFDDAVELAIEKVNADGSKNGSLQFFTGSHAFPAPLMENSTVNPILGHYLYGDVLQMNRLTDPEQKAHERWRYFQRCIKFALAESATVKATIFEFAGQSWQGYEINFTPYRLDPKRSLFERFADKRYVVVVSDDLPGYLFRIETMIPGKDPAVPLIREVLQLTAATAKK